eukprot:XP_017447735.1 PREDICTED: sperm motility kinase X-like isoform X1 [Rattus norvegicus]
MDVLVSGNPDEDEQIVMKSRELESSGHEGNTLIEDYYILGTLGQGSFAQVKVALHLMTQTLVAIKILKRGTRKDFLVISEIDLMTSLYHNHIIRLLQVIDTKHKTFLVMEYAAQGSLRKLVNKRGPLDEEEARSIFRELCLAVNYIHSQNIAHRDIKAENVLLDWEGHVKLSDFGLSKRLTSGEKAKGFCGTAQYCAPEVFGHTQYDMLPADIWSMGILLYYLVIGNLPFKGTVHSKIKYQILSRSWWIPYHLSPQLQNLLRRLMTIEPTMRPSITEILAHPWLRHDQETLSSSGEIPRYPESNIAFTMFLMGFNIQELRDALRERKYNEAMATYLILKKKSPWQPQFYHDGGHSSTLDRREATNHLWPIRRVVSAPNLPMFTLHTHSEVRGDGIRVCKRRHSSLPTLSLLKGSFLENTSPLQVLMPHFRKGKFRKKEGSIDSRTSSSRKGESTTATRTTTTSTTMPITTTASETTSSLFTSSQISTFESRQHSVNESSEYPDTSSSTSSWVSTNSSPFPSKKIQEENTTSSSIDTTQEKKLRMQCQGVPRVPLRRSGWKGLKKRIGKALRTLCCCIPVTNNKIMAANEECCRDSG